MMQKFAHLAIICGPKDSYRRTLNDELQQNNVRDLWTGLKDWTGFKRQSISGQPGASK